MSSDLFTQQQQPGLVTLKFIYNIYIALFFLQACQVLDNFRKSAIWYLFLKGSEIYVSVPMEID